MYSRLLFIKNCFLNNDFSIDASKVDICKFKERCINYLEINLSYIPSLILYLGSNQVALKNVLG